MPAAEAPRLTRDGLACSARPLRLPHATNLGERPPPRGGVSGGAGPGELEGGRVVEEGLESWREDRTRPGGHGP